MFDDLIKQKPYKTKVRYYICVGCDKVLRKGDNCPDCVGKPGVGKPKEIKIVGDENEI
jgi:hypothetical protein